MKKLFLLFAFLLPLLGGAGEPVGAPVPNYYHLIVHRRPFLPPKVLLIPLGNPLGNPVAPQSPSNTDQVLMAVYDAVNLGLRVNANLSGGGTSGPSNADQILSASYDVTNHALRVNCVVGCAGVSFPQLNQVSAPMADSAFPMGTYNLSFTATVADGATVPQVNFITNSAITAGNDPYSFSVKNVFKSISETFYVGAEEEDASAGQIVGLYADVRSSNATGVQGNAFGMETSVQQTAAGTLTEAHAVNAQVSTGNSSGVITNASALYVQSPVSAWAKGIANTYGLFIEDQTGGSLTNQSIKTGRGQVIFGDRLTTKSNAASVQSVAFTGAGLDDATSGGTFSGLSDVAYCVQIDANGTPDTFEWGTGGSCSNGATGVAGSAGAHTLSLGVTITFAATTGHTIGDNWTFTAFAPVSLTLQDHTGATTFKVNETGTVNVTGHAGITASGTSCAITAITGGIITGATCTP